MIKRRVCLLLERLWLGKIMTDKPLNKPTTQKELRESIPASIIHNKKKREQKIMIIIKKEWTKDRRDKSKR